MSWLENRPKIAIELLSSSPIHREAAVQQIVNVAQQIKDSPEILPDITDLLFSTYDHYQDHESRHFVQNAFKSLFQESQDLFIKEFARLVSPISQSPKAIAVSDLMTLLEWTNSIIELSISHESVSALILAQAGLLQHILQLGLKPRLRNSAWRIVRTSLVNVGTVAGTSGFLLYLETLLSNSSQLCNLILLNCLCLAALDLSTSAPQIHALITENKSRISSVYIQHVLGIKSHLSAPLVSCFRPLFTEYYNQDDFTQLVPAISKSLLRAPEIVLINIIPDLIDSIPSIIDMAQATLDKLLSQLLNLFNSSNPLVREASSESLQKLIRHCYDGQLLLKIASDLTTPLSKTSAADQRVFFGRSILAVKPDSLVSKAITSNMVISLNKEANEAALESLTSAFFKHAFASLLVTDGATLDKSVSDCITKGLGDKRLNLRKIWITSLGYELFNLNHASESLKNFLKRVIVPIEDTFKEVLANPIAHIQSKSLTSAYVPISLAKKLSSWDISIATDNQTSLFAEKIYTKLTTIQDFTWLVRALSAATNALRTSDKVSKDILLAWLFLCSDTPPIIQQHAIQALNQAYIDNQSVVGDALIADIYSSLFSKSTAESSHYPRLSHIISSIFNSPELVDKKILLNHLALLAIPAHHSSIHIKNGWVGLCVRAGIDPGELVQQNGDIIIKQVVEIADDLSTALPAATAAAATLSFVSPNFIAPKLREEIVSLLNPSNLSNLSENDLKIWKTPKGTLSSDLFEKSDKKVYSEHKNSKEYEARKWEEDVRREIAKKHGKAVPTKKLSREEQVKVNEELAKEEAIRSNIRTIYNTIMTGVALISALSKQAETTDNGVETWFPVSVLKLLELIKLFNTSVVIQQPIYQCFIDLSSNISERIGASARPFLGVAILRASGCEAENNIPPQYLEEPLDSMATRLLYRLRFLSDQRPLDLISLTYIMPLVLQSIQGKGGIGTKSEAVIDEQIMLSLDIISAHSEQFKSSIVPRAEVIEALIALMINSPAKAKTAKGCLNSVIQSISANITREELDKLLQGVVSGDAFVRTAILEIIDAELEISYIKYSSALWVARFDDDPANEDLGQSIWEENELSIDSDTPLNLIDEYLGSDEASLRRSTSRAIAQAVAHVSESDIFIRTYRKLVEFYADKSRPPPTIYDKFGVAIKTTSGDKDHWEARSGAALTFRQLVPLFDDETALDFLDHFLINDTKALADKNAAVREQMKQAGITLIQIAGHRNLEKMIPIFESYLAKPDSKSETQDRISEAAIILYGALARHLPVSDPRVSQIVNRLLKTLDIPSEDVQYAVSQCLSPLVKLFDPTGDQLSNYFEELLEKLFSPTTKLPQRRGAAYGLAGLVRGAGISSLSDYNIIRSLTDAVEDKKEPKKRQGAQFAFECLSETLGRMFEPYALELLPLILSCLGDSNTEVREATTHAARNIMKNTTGYGIKKLIPLTLENLDQTAWRAKKGSVELLGTMAYLDPQQLSASLSTIIPEIVGVLNDTHKEVRSAANSSLKKFGEVIRNPEIQSLVPVLIQAISNPTKHTEEALDGLLKTQFVHYIDAPSLALVIHVLHRGLKDRSAGTKRKACQIVGNMSILTDSKDLISYLPSLVAELQVSMVDPVPATRATASRALGSLVEKLGEPLFPDLIPRLLATLRSEDRPGDRLGAAQGLSEVIYGLGIRKLEELLPTILRGCTSTQAHVRDGFMPLMIFLPACFGPNLTPYLSQIIPPILSGLADSQDTVRETSLKAGRLLVRNYATKAIEILLPELERGLSDSSWRIRLSSVELTGDLLFQVTGLSRNAEATAEENENEEDVSAFSNDVNKNLVDVLGVERRDRILAALFVCRTDVANQVRVSAVEVWKVLVANTPRTVKEILPTLTQIIIRRLASSDEEQRTIAASTLGELIRRVGGNALSQLLPTFQEGIVSGDSDAKQGICIAISELINSTSEETLEDSLGVIVYILRTALVEVDPTVREVAAKTFDNLQQAIGNRAVDLILPDLIAMMQQDSASSEIALAALRQIMATKASVVFPVLIPTLLAPPMTAFNARSLAALVSVAGSALHRRLSSIVDALVNALILETDSDTVEQIGKTLDTVLLSVVSEDGVHILMQHMLSLARNEESRKRKITFEHMAPFFAESSLDYSIYVQDWISLCIASLDDSDSDVVVASWTALNELTKHLSKEDMERLVRPVRQALRLSGLAGQDLPGFALPKGPSCILPIFLHSLMYGSSDQREQAALGIADVVERTSSENLKPYVTQMTGPLIRTIGDRFPSDVKAAILYTLNVLLTKIPTFLKPFLPQLQRTFAKSLSDPSNETLRNRANRALATLIPLQSRIDPLVTELLTGARNADSDAVVASILRALSDIVTKAGSRLSSASTSLLFTYIEDELLDASGGLVDISTPDVAGQIIRTQVFDALNNHFGILVINAVLLTAVRQIDETGLSDEIGNYISDNITSNDAFVSENAILASGKLLLSLENITLEEDTVDRIIEQLTVATGKSASRSSESRRLALVVIRTVSRKNPTVIESRLEGLVPAIFACVRETVIPIKLAAEKAYLGIFHLVEQPNSSTFDQWLSRQGDKLAANNLRSIQDYTRRVATRLATAERERIDAGGDESALYSDRIEDEREIWSIGTVEIEVEDVA